MMQKQEGHEVSPTLTYVIVLPGALAICAGIGVYCLGSWVVKKLRAAKEKVKVMCNDQDNLEQDELEDLETIETQDDLEDGDGCDDFGDGDGDGDDCDDLGEPDAPEDCDDFGDAVESGDCEPCEPSEAC